MYKKSYLRPILFGLIAVFFASCDKDFNEFGTNIVGDDHFGFEKYTDATVRAYNQKLGEIASNNLPINALGFYSNPAYGTTQADFVTQAELSTTNPVFNNTDPTLYNTMPTVLDSVVMEIPYFKKFKSIDDNKVSTYTLDSIYGEKPYDQTAATNNSKFKLSVYQSNYFLRDLDPDQSLVQQQLYYTGQNQIDVINSNLTNSVPLNNAGLTDANASLDGIHNADGHENSAFYFDKREHRTMTFKDDGVTPVYTRSVPSMRLHLNKTVFSNLILTAPSGSLADPTTFKNYFRGLYFKVENGNPGNMAMINFKGGKITLYYNEDKKKTSSSGVVSFERVYKTYVLNLTGNTISLLKNSDENAEYLTAANNTTQEASKLYLKGGEGSMAIIDLFGTTDTKGYILNPLYNANVHLSPTNLKYTVTIGPNGVSDEIDDIVINGWLINEANLTFYIDQTSLKSDDLDPNIRTKVVEPNRIYLYDLTNKKPIVDYTYDLTTDGKYPKLNKYIFGGILANENGSGTKQIRNADGEITNKGTKYKIRLTNYVRNLISKDSTNIRLGLSVTESIANIGLSKLKTPNTNSAYAPTMSVMSPLGTILYGTGPTSDNLPEDKKLKLEIYYTKPY